MSEALGRWGCGKVISAGEIRGVSNGGLGNRMQDTEKHHRADAEVLKDQAPLRTALHMPFCSPQGIAMQACTEFPLLLAL